MSGGAARSGEKEHLVDGNGWRHGKNPESNTYKHLPENAVAFHICFKFVTIREGINHEATLKIIHFGRTSKHVERSEKYKHAMAQIMEWHVLAADVIDDVGEKIKLAPVVSCYHCRIVIEVYPDGTPVGGEWYRCSSCKNTVCGPDCDKMGHQCWGSKADETDGPTIEGMGAVKAPQPTTAPQSVATSCER